jgi:hypothetical protein
VGSRDLLWRIETTRFQVFKHNCHGTGNCLIKHDFHPILISKFYIIIGTRYLTSKSNF